MIAAVVLAAGLSRRMGRSKLSLPWGNTTIIGQVVTVLANSGAAEVVVVTGGDRELVEAALEEFSVRIVYNPDFHNESMLTSFQTGLSAVSPRIKAVLVALGDQPHIESRVVESVLKAYHDSHASIVVPSAHGRRGHPWLLDRSLWAQALAMLPPATLRDFLNSFQERIVYVETNTESIFRDLDTPEDYERARPAGS